MRIGYNRLFSTDVFENKINQAAVSHDLNLNFVETEISGISRGEIDVFAYPLHLYENGADLKKAALVEMGDRNYNLNLRKDLLDDAHRLGFRKGMEIYCPTYFNQSCIKLIYNDFSYTPLEIEKLLKSIKGGDLPGFIVESCFSGQFDLSNYKTIKLNSREFGHQAGQGFMVLLTDRKSPYWKIVRNLNSRQVIAVSNIERKISKLKGENICVHCEMDQNENFQVWMNNGEKTAHISQSTRVEIEQRIINKLENS